LGYQNYVVAAYGELPMSDEQDYVIYKIEGDNTLYKRTAIERRPVISETLPGQPAYPRASYHQDAHNYNYSAEESGSQIDYTKYIRGIFKRKWLIAILVFMTTILVTFEMYRRKEYYQSYSVISIGKEDTSLVKYGENDLVIQSDESIKTKLFMLNSPSLIEDVIVQMKLDQNPELLKSEKRTLRETFKSIGNRIFLKPTVPPALNITGAAVIPEATMAPAYQLSPADRWALEPYVVLFDEMYSVEAISDTRLIKIKFTHPDPVLAAAVCNRITQFFMQRNFQGKTDKLNETSEWLERTTQELKSKAEKAEQALADYSRGHTIIAPQGNGSLAAEKVARLQAEVTRAETERIIKESLHEEAKRGRVALIPEAFTNLRVTELQKKLGELTIQSAQLDVNYGPDHPQSIEINQQIASIQKQIDSYGRTMEEKLRIDYERAVRDEKSLKAAMAAARQNGAQENAETIQFGILQQEVETSKSLYRGFLEKSNQAKFEMAQQENNIHLIQSARTPSIDIGPHRKLWILIGLVSSLFLGVGLAILLEYFDQTILNIDDIDRHLQLSTLAAIPRIDLPSGRSFLQSKPVKRSAGKPGESFLSPALALDSHSQAAEAYRLLVASLMLSVDIDSSKTLLFTSSQPNEGKTTTTINTAMSIAQLGKSVLIIDCDLRTPRISDELGIKPGPGLSEYLLGKAELNNVIQKYKKQNLSVLPSGSIPEKPAELISSQRMKVLLAAVYQHYDHIIIDSPPMTNLADPVILSTLVDGVIFVVHAGESNRDVVRRSRRELLSVGANILGVVLNLAPISHNKYSDAYFKPLRRELTGGRFFKSPPKA
jgi:polysaccharide biosynthesis transport protein